MVRGEPAKKKIGTKDAEIQALKKTVSAQKQKIQKLEKDGKEHDKEFKEITGLVEKVEQKHEKILKSRFELGCMKALIEKLKENIAEREEDRLFLASEWVQAIRTIQKLKERKWVKRMVKQTEALDGNLKKTRTACLVDEILHKQQEIEELMKNHEETLDWYEDKVANGKETSAEMEQELRRLKNQPKHLEYDREMSQLKKDIEEQRFQVDYMVDQAKFVEKKFNEDLEKEQKEMSQLKEQVEKIVNDLSQKISELTGGAEDDLDDKDNSRYAMPGETKTEQIVDLVERILENQKECDQFVEARDEFNDTQSLEIHQLKEKMKSTKKEVEELEEKGLGSELSKKEQREMKLKMKEIENDRKKLKSIEEELAETTDTYNHELDEKSSGVMFFRDEMERVVAAMKSKVLKLGGVLDEAQRENLTGIEENPAKSSEKPKRGRKPSAAPSVQEIVKDYPKVGSFRKLVQDLQEMMKEKDDNIDNSMERFDALEQEILKVMEQNKDYEQKLAEKDAEIKELTEQMGDQPSPKKRKIPSGAVVDTDQLLSKIGRLTMELEAKEAEIKKLQAAEKH